MAETAKQEKIKLQCNRTVNVEERVVIRVYAYNYSVTLYAVHI